MLSNKKKNYFIKKINMLHSIFESLSVQSGNPPLALDQFENKLTLKELRQCFFETTAENFEARLTALLKERWERIRNSSMCYTKNTRNRVNQLCVELAMAISPPVTTKAEIDALKPNTGPYFLLMPSLENSEDVYGENIHHLGLHEFVLSDQERVFIPVATCLHEASVSDQGKLRHMVMIDGAFPFLSFSEAQRVAYHSKQATELFQAVLIFNNQRLLGDDIDAQLRQLAVALRGGSTQGSGTEYNAGAVANVGIFEFHHYWESLSEKQKTALFEESPELKNIIERLFRPDHVDYTQTRYCVQLLAGSLDPIIEAFSQKPSIQFAKLQVKTLETQLNDALKNDPYLVLTNNVHPPKHILHRMFELPRSLQQEIFKQNGYENALMYALAHDLDAVSEFKLSKKDKQQVVTATVSSGNEYALIAAAKEGKIKVIESLLRWGANIESRDKNGSTALHWAANNGPVETVKYLLEKGASLNSQGHNGATALYFAVINNNAEIANWLLEQNASLNIRCQEGDNAIDVACFLCPSIVEPMLKKIATLPTEQQAECLINVLDGPYPNVLHCAAVYAPDLFNALMTTALSQTKIMSNDPLFTTVDRKGYTPLLLAAQLGQTEIVRKLIDLGLDIESRDKVGNRALHWAAKEGHLETITYLLEKGALLDSKGHKNATALQMAVSNENIEAAKLLLTRHPDITHRDQKGENALDKAIDKTPALIEPILIDIAKLSADEQAECFLNVPQGPYPNVFFYAAAHKPSLLQTLLAITLEQRNLTPNDKLFTNTNQQGLTACILAAQQGKIQTVRQFIDFGVDINAYDGGGNTALFWAVKNGHLETIQYLLEKGACQESKEQKGPAALYFAITHQKVEAAKLLLQKLEVVTLRDAQGENALDKAIKNCPQLVKPILMRITRLPAHQQAECLLKVPGGLWPNVLFCALSTRASRTNCFEKLLQSFGNSRLDSLNATDF